MTSFIRREMQQHVRDGFSILLPVADMVRLSHQRLRLILNLLEQPDEETPMVNDTMDRKIAP